MIFEVNKNGGYDHVCYVESHNREQVAILFPSPQFTVTEIAVLTPGQAARLAESHRL